MSLKDSILKIDSNPGKIKHQWVNNLDASVRAEVDEVIDDWLRGELYIHSKLPTKASLYKHVVAYYSLQVGLTTFKSYMADRLNVLKRLSEETSG